MKNLLIILLFVSCASNIPVQKLETIEPTIEDIGYYKNESSLDWITESIEIANCVTKKKEFHQEILDNGKFEHYDGLNQHIIDMLISETPAIVGTYYKKFSKARAYRNIGSNKIWLNRAKISNSDEDLLNTMLHERLHVLGFGHKGNSRNKYNNIDSVPYKVGSISEKYYQYCLTKTSGM